MLNGVGLVVILACVFGSFILAGGKMDIILHALPHEMMAICGAALGAFLVGNSMAVVKKAGKGLVRAFKAPRWKDSDYRDLLTWDCHDFRVWAGIMGKKESPYVPTQRTRYT